MRPPIERMRAAWEKCDRESFRPEIALCDYALALEKEKAELEKCLETSPWPKDIWTMTIDEYIEAIPYPELKTRISGFLMRQGWEAAESRIKQALNEEQ